MDNKVSVIVTAYNSESTIHKCLSSIERQTYHNFEVIVVVDGAIDSTLEIVKSFSSRDSRFRYIYKENGGHSRAKNSGLDLVDGKFVTFVDSDDYISENHLELLVGGIEDSQLSICGIINEYEDKSEKSRIEVGTGKFDKFELLDRMLISKHEIGGYNCNKLYLMDVIKQYNIRFPDGNYYYEDIFFSYNYIQHISSGVCIAECTYHYIHYNNAGMTRGLGDTSKWLHYVDVFDIMIDENKIEYDNFLNKLRLQKVWLSATAVRVLAHFECTDTEEYKKLRKYIGKNLVKYLLCTRLPLKKRLGGVLTYFCPKLAFKLWNGKG